MAKSCPICAASHRKDSMCVNAIISRFLSVLSKIDKFPGEDRERLEHRLREWEAVAAKMETLARKEGSLGKWEDWGDVMRRVGCLRCGGKLTFVIGMGVGLHESAPNGWTCEKRNCGWESYNAPLFS